VTSRAAVQALPATRPRTKSRWALRGATFVSMVTRSGTYRACQAAKLTNAAPRALMRSFHRAVPLPAPTYHLTLR